MKKLEEYLKKSLPEAIAAVGSVDLEEGRFGQWLLTGLDEPGTSGFRKAEKLMRRYEIKKSYLTSCVEKKALMMNGSEVRPSLYWLAILILVNRGLMDGDLRFWNTALKILDSSDRNRAAENLRELIEEHFSNFLVA